ncbi:FAD-dependent oxidoreductase [Actinoplanes sp. TBRC 11911]|uniref:NAD(P)/FAD-dependent oxidoreductase n=1 Tax=Actinoplanes sp. TBRC 11911 TaxID=2729386 RepID=UPI00145F7E10|nr:NAD(P)/FAD-dependent oxidoreductase [Actinoplanes sp. TBRC 11911]NMO52432.1 FAD-dependent oxidoreductase [Actinoplanes sp. TBRC 11911]
MTRDVLVVGAGPAGLAAALAARRGGASVTLLDAADDVGGQYWRHLPPQRPAGREAKLHHGWRRFAALRRRLDADPGCEVLVNAQVWLVERRDDGAPDVHVLVGAADGGGRRQLTFRAWALVLATGASERTLPFPGWELPGVFTAGAAQALAKAERIAVGGDVLVAGAGPFLLPVATSLVRTGARVRGVLEANGWGRLGRAWTAKPAELAASWRKGAELAGYVKDLARYRVPYRTATAVIAAHGTDRVEAVTVARLDPQWAPISGTEKQIEVDAVCVSHGFIPRTELAVAAGCRLRSDGTVAIDANGRTSVDGVFAAGEITGIGGAGLALTEGAIAGTAAAGRPAEGAASARTAAPAITGVGITASAGNTGAPQGRGNGREGPAPTGEQTSPFPRRLENAHGIRPGWTSWLTPDTVVCRCEEVTLGDLTRAARETESRGLRSLKLSTRAGLGVCQGRVCGRTVEELLTQATGGLLDPGRTQTRPIAALVRLGELAAQHEATPHEATPHEEGSP